MKSLFFAWIVFFGSFSDYEYQYIKITNLQQKPIVEGNLNGKKAYFLLDTGSDITILNKNDAQKFGFQTLLHDGERNDAIGVGGKTSAITSTENVNMELGSTRIMTRFLSYDLSDIVKNNKKRSGIQITGIIGSDAMKRYGIIIDYHNKKVGILTSKKVMQDEPMISALKNR